MGFGFYCYRKNNFNFLLQNKDIDVHLPITQLCKIKYKNKELNGFFLHINKISNISLKALFIYDYIFDQDYKFINKKIELILYKKSSLKSITIDKSRKFYSKDKYTIIEIKKTDNLNDISFLEIDNEVNDNISNINSINLYILHFPKDKNNEENNDKFLNKKYDINNGKIIKLNNDNFEFSFPCENDFVGCPILNSSNHFLN